MYHSTLELEPLEFSGPYHTAWILVGTTYFQLGVPFLANSLIEVLNKALPGEAIPTSAEVHDVFAASPSRIKVSHGKEYPPPACIERGERRSEFRRVRDPRLIALGGGDFDSVCGECWFARSNTAGCPIRTRALEIAARH